MAPCKSIAGEVSFEWSSPQRILSTDSKDRTTLDVSLYMTLAVKELRLAYTEQLVTMTGCHDRSPSRELLIFSKRSVLVAGTTYANSNWCKIEATGR